MSGTAQTPTPTENLTSRIGGGWVVLSRLIWGLAAGVMLVPTALGVVPRYEQLLAQAAADPGITLAPQTYATSIVALASLYAITFSLVAVFIYVRRPNDWMALLASTMLMAIGTSGSDFSDALLVNSPQLFPVVDLIRSMGLGLPVVILFLFPNGIAYPRWLRYPAFFYVAFVMVRPFFYTVEPLHPRFWAPGVVAVWYAVWLGAGLISRVQWFTQQAGPTERQQTKWLLYGSFVAALGFLLIQVVRAVAPAIDPTINVDGGTWFLYEYIVYVLIGLPVPVTFAISILRFRLWDIDFIINRSLVYGALTALLVVLFGGSLLALTSLATNLGFQQASIIAVVIAATVFGLLFSTLRERLQRFVDKRFYGIDVNYRRKQRTGQQVSVTLRPSDRTSFGEYSGLELIGSGGMADVYRATHPTLQAPVAIKVLLSRLADDDTFRRRFEREARIIAQLKHRNIVAISDYGQNDDLAYMVMEYIDGPTLSGLMEEHGTFTLAQALPILKDVAAALDYAHEHNLVHRDVKPSNIMVEGYGTPKQRAVLMDFGIARITGSTTTLTQSGVVGTFHYMCPEQIQSIEHIDGRADIYALGVLTHQLLTGKLPFNSPNPGAVLIAHLQQPPPDVRKTNAGIPRAAAYAIMRAMAKNPADRFPTVASFIEALEVGLAEQQAA